MSLYEDIISNDEIGENADNKSKNNWINSPSINLLQHHLMNKKQSKNQTFKPRPAISNNPNFFKTKTLTTNIIPQTSQSVTLKSGSLLGGDWNISLEYDPLWPNDYEKIINEKNEKVQTLNDSDNTKSSFHNLTVTTTLGSRPLVDAYSDDEDDKNNESTFKKPTKGAAIAPPPLLTKVSSTTNHLPSTPETPSLNMNVSDVAAKIMARMGYQEGKGLGKNKQGIATALQIEKINKTGVIISNNQNIVTNTNKEDFGNFTATPSSQQIASTAQQESITEIIKNPTKVVMLRNMVGQGEVDEDLDPEVREECSKFGEVVNCIVYEVNEGLVNGKKLLNNKNISVSDDEAVRIFVEFSRVESAIKALVDLNGRYFGGRVVKGLFYDLEKFRKMELAE